MCPKKKQRKTFLIVVDDSSELNAALNFACKRAINTSGKVALFHAVELSDFHHFASIAELMEIEARSEAEKLIQRVAADVQKQTKQMPVLFLRQGKTIEQLLHLINEEKDIAVLVLGARMGEEGPGPIVTAVSGQLAGKISLPVTIIPGNLTVDEIEALT
ncbi:MAG: universal stress protein [Pseudomonadota bacterium]|nr:universal stress protein [Pseudomonadota bacterium]